MKGLSFILLGSNLGDREAILESAVDMIEERCGSVVLMSSLYESEPWGFETENLFLNQAIGVETGLSPHDLLNELLQIEAELGRVRRENHQGYESRPIDLDVIYSVQSPIFVSTEITATPYREIATALRASR